MSVPGVFADVGVAPIARMGPASLDGTTASLIEASVGLLANPAGKMVDCTARIGLQELVALGVGIERPLQWVSA